MRDVVGIARDTGGFSLVELMVAVGIIGVMSSVAVPKYQKFRANAAQSEAQATLSSIYTLQQLYYTENDYYAGFDLSYADATGKITTGDNHDLKFQPSPNARYRYTGARYTSGTAPREVAASVTNFKELRSAVQFKAVADSNTPLASCAEAKNDVWCVNQDKILTNQTDSIGVPCAVDTPPAVSDGGCS